MIQTKNYPKTHVKLKEFVKDMLTVWVKEAAGEDPGTITDEYLEGVLEPLLESQKRMLYDFLDKHLVYLQPHLLDQLNPEAGWGFSISHVGGIDDEHAKYSNRREAEEAGYIRAFKILEDLL